MNLLSGFMLISCITSTFAQQFEHVQPMPAFVWSNKDVLPQKGTYMNKAVHYNDFVSLFNDAFGKNKIEVQHLDKVQYKTDNVEDTVDMIVGFIVPELDTHSFTRFAGGYSLNKNSPKVNFLKSVLTEGPGSSIVFPELIFESSTKSDGALSKLDAEYACIDTAPENYPAGGKDCFTLDDLTDMLGNQDVPKPTKQVQLVYLSDIAKLDETIAKICNRIYASGINYVAFATGSTPVKKMVSLPSINRVERSLADDQVQVVNSHPDQLMGFLVTLSFILILWMLFAGMQGIKAPSAYVGRYPYKGRVFE